MGEDLNFKYYCEVLSILIELYIQPSILPLPVLSTVVPVLVIACFVVVHGVALVLG